MSRRSGNADVSVLKHRDLVSAPLRSSSALRRTASRIANARARAIGDGRVVDAGLGPSSGLTPARRIVAFKVGSWRRLFAVRVPTPR